MMAYKRMREEMLEIIAEFPIIAAVKDEKELKESLMTDCKVIFILFGNICNISDIVEKIKNKDKLAIIHADLVQGLSAKTEAIDYLKLNTKADGIISTKGNLVKYAVEIGLIGILRNFIIDSMAMENVNKQVSLANPDMVEIMPGIMPEIIEKIKSELKLPLIAGGLISEKKDVIAALAAGADAVSTTKIGLWKE
jgi:hypothetical protein